MKHALLRTLPGRAIVIGAAVKVVVFALGLVSAVPGWLRLIDTEQRPAAKSLQEKLSTEAQELMNIFGAIFRKCEDRE